MPRSKSSTKPQGLKKPPLTHFLCLPLVTSASKPQLETSLEVFREAVCPTPAEVPSTDDENKATLKEDAILPTVHPKAIRPVGVLHCTLGVMSLDQQQLDDALSLLQSLDITKLLQEADSTAHETNQRSLEPMKINLKGLVSMHAPTSTSILYTAPTDPSNRLYPFSLSLQSLFKSHNFLVDDDRDLKLHATIVNTIYAKGKNTPRRATGSSPSRQEGHGPNAKAGMRINAAAILEKFQEFVFAEDVVLDRVAICEMGAKKILDGSGRLVMEEYFEVGSVRLPS